MKLQSRVSESRSSIRILLWDVDGTLLVAPRGGAYKDYFAPAMERVFGSSGILRDEINVSGKTDLQIAFECLQPEGFTLEQIRAKADEFTCAMGEEIERVAGRDNEHFVRLPGVAEVLRATAENPLFVNALLTGNLPSAALYKLKFVNLDRFFDFSLGAFGDRSHNRNDLPSIAARNFAARYDYEFAASQFIVLGDTPKDIACARYFGAKSIAVATGRNHPPETLLPFDPDYLFEDLTDAAEVLRILENI